MRTIALWGPTSSGKTVVLAQLYLRFPSAGPWKIFPTPETQDFVELMRATMVNRREFPLGTREEKDASNKISYEFENVETHRRIRLFTEDKAGVFSETLPDEELARFMQAHGLVMMIDRRRPNFETEVWKAIERFYHGVRVDGEEKDKRPVAFCLAKADLYIHTPADYRRALHEPEAFALDHFPPAFVERLADFCPNRKFFPISSVGVRLRHGLVEPTIYYDQRMLVRIRDEVFPIHLSAPFEWLFDKMGGE
jgi:hypothetical protein